MCRLRLECNCAGCTSKRNSDAVKNKPLELTKEQCKILKQALRKSVKNIEPKELK